MLRGHRSVGETGACTLSCAQMPTALGLTKLADSVLFSESEFQLLRQLQFPSTGLVLEPVLEPVLGVTKLITHMGNLSAIDGVLVFPQNSYVEILIHCYPPFPLPALR